MNKRTIITGIIKLHAGDLVRVNRDKIYLIGEFDVCYILSLPFKTSAGKEYTWHDIKEVDNITIKSITEK